MGKALIVEILGDAKEFAHELDHAAGKTRQMGKAAGVAGLALAGGLAFGIEKSVEAAMEGQQSQAALDQALKTTHQSVQAMSPALEDAQKAGRGLGFTSDETRSSLARLELATGNTKSAVADLSIAEGLARVKHMDLATATSAMAMAMTGSQRAAKQLGISVAPVTEAVHKLRDAGVDNSTALGRHELALAALQDKMATGKEVIAATSALVKGQAQAYADTAAGGMAQFHAQTEQLKETLGNALLPAITSVSGKLADLAGYLTQHTTLAKVLVGVLGTFAAILLTVSAAARVMTSAQILLNSALFANPIGIVILALIALGAALVVLWTKSETFRDIVTSSLTAVKNAAKVVADFFTVDVPAAFERVITWLRSNWPVVATIIAGPFAPIVALATNAFGIRSALEDAFGAIKNAVGNAIDSVVGTVRSLPGRIVGALGNVAGLLFNAGSAIIGGLLDGLKSRLGEVADLAKSIAGLISHLKGPLEYDRKLLVPHGQAIIEGLRTGMEGSLSGLLGSVGGYAPAIQAAAGPAFAGAGGGGGDLHATFVLQTPDGEVMWRQTQRYALRALARNGSTGIR